MILVWGFKLLGFSFVFVVDLSGMPTSVSDFGRTGVVLWGWSRILC